MSNLPCSSNNTNGRFWRIRNSNACSPPLPLYLHLNEPMVDELPHKQQSLYFKLYLHKRAGMSWHLVSSSIFERSKISSSIFISTVAAWWNVILFFFSSLIHGRRPSQCQTSSPSSPFPCSYTGS